MKIAVVLGSVRDVRLGEKVAAWVLEQSKDSQKHQYELVDLKDYDLPLYSEAKGPNGLNREYTNPANIAWSEKIDSYDAFIFVSAEYNRMMPGAFKNAFDSLGPEWRDKRVGLVGYGYGQSGKGAINAWKITMPTFNMQILDNTVSFSLGEDLENWQVAPRTETKAALKALLEEFETLS